jgi:hypothetical protein
MVTRRHRHTDASKITALGLLVVVIALLALTVLTASANAETLYAKAKRIIYATFPDSTQDAALRVVACETGNTFSPWSYNRSGASGYFQILQGNAGRVLDYNGHKMIIPRGQALFNPWTNAKVALFLSHGGTDWHEWVCRP